jgi:CRISPR-associated protein Cas5h
MNKDVLVFYIQGKFGHFKKYYSNKSSLTYKLPPSTVIMGMIASVLEEPRDSYYNWLSPPNSKIGIKIITQGFTHFECMNYLDYSNPHVQTRLELLKAKDGNICYKIYFNSNDIKKIEKLVEKLKAKEFGYGIYLGQRQFIGFAEIDNIYQVNDVYSNYEGLLETLTFKDNIIELLDNSDKKLNIDMMPIAFKNEENGKSRISELKSQVVYEETGKSINGKFKEVLQLSNNEITSFFTPFKEI